MTDRNTVDYTPSKDDIVLLYDGYQIVVQTVKSNNFIFRAISDTHSLSVLSVIKISLNILLYKYHITHIRVEGSNKTYNWLKKYIGKGVYQDTDITDRNVYYIDIKVVLK